MSEPLSCVKCGAPRTKHICAYCGARYSAPEPEPAQIVGDLIFSYRDMPGAKEVSNALRRKASAQGVLRSGRHLQDLMGFEVAMAQMATRIVG